MYTSVKEIAAKISRNYKSLDYNLYDVVEWCGECEKHIGEYKYFLEYEKVKIPVENCIAVLPCNIIRLINVTGAGCKELNYYRDANLLKFSSDKFDIFIDYLGMPVDEEGFPLIMLGHEEACYYYCLKRLMEPDFIMGKMNIASWQYIMGQYEIYVTKAKNSAQHLSKRDMDKINMIKYNVIKNVRTSQMNNFKP